MPTISVFNITGGNPPNPGSGNTSTGESTVAFDTTSKSLKLFDGTTLYNIYSDQATPLSIAAGTVAAATVTAAEQGGTIVHKTILTLSALAVTVVDANVGGGAKIYTFPEGRILLLGAVGSIAVTTTSALASTLNAGVTGNWGLGSVQTTSQGSGTLATTQQDMLATTNFTSSATINVAGAASTGKLAASAQFDGTATAQPVWFNIGVAGATDIDGDATVTVSGTLTLTWVFLGDY